MNKTDKRARLDWSLLIFIIPIGIILIIIVGQLAVRLMPNWSVDADMRSNLEPNPNARRSFFLLRPLLPQILTPMAWAGDYLESGGEISFPEFISFIPTASPSSTPVPPTGTQTTPVATSTPSPSATVGTGTPASTQPPNSTKPPNGGVPPPPNEILGCKNPNALNYNPLATVDDGSCIPKVLGCTDPAAFNYNSTANVDNGSCVAKVLGCTDPAASNYNSTANVDNGSCKYPVVSNPSGTQMTPPSELGVGTLPDNTTNTDNNIAHITDGTYVVVNLPVVVNSVPDGNYDLVFYEYNNGGVVYLDLIIIGLSNSLDGSNYYEVFSWGDNDRDANSNVKDVITYPGTESGAQAVPAAILYDPDGSGGSNPAPQSGILIDVDTAASNPPPGTYNYVVIISPPGGVGGSAQVDAIQTVDEPIPP